MFWLACAAVGFLAAVGAAVLLSLALDGAGAWRGGPAPSRQLVEQHRLHSNGNAAAAPVLAPALSGR